MSNDKVLSIYCGVTKPQLDFLNAESAKLLVPRAHVLRFLIQMYIEGRYSPQPHIQVFGETVKVGAKEKAISIRPQQKTTFKLMQENSFGSELRNALKEVNNDD